MAGFKVHLDPRIGFLLRQSWPNVLAGRALPFDLSSWKITANNAFAFFSTQNDKPYMVFGTPGGDQQDQWSTIMFLHHADHGMNLQEAIDYHLFIQSTFLVLWPRSRQPKKIVLEDRFPQTTIDELIRRGHQIEVGASWSEAD